MSIKTIDIDQSSFNPATLLSVFDDIQDLFAEPAEAQNSGYKKDYALVS